MLDTTVLAINYIVKTPGICGGVPRVDGTRITVDWIVGQMIYAGQTLDDVVEDYSHIPLTAAQIHAALAYYYDHQAEIDNLIDEGETQLNEVRRGGGVKAQTGYVSARAAAEILGLDHESRQVAKLCRDGLLTGRKIANRWMIAMFSIDAYQRSNRKPGPKSGSHSSTER